MSGSRIEGRSGAEPDRAFIPLGGMGQDGFERLCETGRELLEFWFDRVDCVGESAQRILTCRSVEEMQRVQERYLQDMLRAHAALWSRLPASLLMRPTTARPSEAATVRPLRAA